MLRYSAIIPLRRHNHGFSLSALRGTNAAQVGGQVQPSDATQAVYRADNIGIDYQLVPYGAYYAAQLTRDPCARLTCVPGSLPGWSSHNP